MKNLYNFLNVQAALLTVLLGLGLVSNPLRGMELDWAELLRNTASTGASAVGSGLSSAVSSVAPSWRQTIGGVCSTAFNSVLQNPAVACVLGVGGVGYGAYKYFFAGSATPVDEATAKKIQLLMESLNAFVDPLKPQSHPSALKARMITGKNINAYQESLAELTRIAKELKADKQVAEFVAILNDTKKSEDVILNEARAYLNEKIAPLFVVKTAGGQAQPSVPTTGGIQPSDVQSAAFDKQALLAHVGELEKALNVQGLKTGNVTIAGLVAKAKELAKGNPEFANLVERLEGRINNYLAAASGTPARTEARGILMSRVENLKNVLKGIAVTQPTLATQTATTPSLRLETREAVAVEPIVQAGGVDKASVLAKIKALESALNVQGLVKGDKGIADLVNQISTAIMADPDLTENFVIVSRNIDDLLSAPRNTEQRTKAREALVANIQKYKAGLV